MRTGDGVDGGAGNGPVGAGFCGGISSGFTTRNCRFKFGLAASLLVELELVELCSVLSDLSVVVTSELVAETADVGAVSSSLESSGRSKRSLIHDP